MPFNAHKLFITDNRYILKPEYKTELHASLNHNVPFVNNRCRIAELSSKEEAKKYYSEAIDNAQEVLSENQTMELPVEHFLEPQSFINEFILEPTLPKKI